MHPNYDTQNLPWFGWDWDCEAELGLFVISLDVREDTPVVIHPAQPADGIVAPWAADAASWSKTKIRTLKPTTESKKMALYF